jgi:hypothetical protein
VSRDARLAFILWRTNADDEGRLRGNSRMLASLLFPYDNDATDLISGWLSELERENCIFRYQVLDKTSQKSNEYIEIHNWLGHQKIDHPSKSKFPSRKFANRSLVLAKTSVGSKDQGPRTKDRTKEGIVSKEASRKIAKPTIEQVAAYCTERGNGIDAGTFFDFYEVNGWVQGKGQKPIKDWRAAVRTWERNQSAASRAGQPLSTAELETYNPVDGGGA